MTNSNQGSANNVYPVHTAHHNNEVLYDTMLAKHVNRLGLENTVNVVGCYQSLAQGC